MSRSVAHRVTIADVARTAQCAKSTVSYVLNHTPGRTISPETRRRIEQTARALKYAPNPTARALGRGHSDQIYVLAASAVGSYFTSAWLAAIQQCAYELGYATQVLPSVVTFPASQRRRMLDEILVHRPAGIIAMVDCLTAVEYRTAVKAGVPACALIGVEPAAYATTVLLPARHAAEIAGEYLCARGHTQIGFLTWPALPGMPSIGLKHALAGLTSVTTTHGGTVTEIPLDLGLEGARTAVTRLLAGDRPPTAIYGYRDEFCFPVLKALLERGVRVPQDIALVGTEGHPMDEILHPALTSVRYDIGSLGARGVHVVDALVHGGSPDPARLTPLVPQLVERESS